MKKIQKKKVNRGQTSIEYMLLFGMVVAVFFIFFSPFVTRINIATNRYFNEVSEGVMGDRVNGDFLDRHTD